MIQGFEGSVQSSRIKVKVKGCLKPWLWTRRQSRSARERRWNKRLRPRDAAHETAARRTQRKFVYVAARRCMPLYKGYGAGIEVRGSLSGVRVLGIGAEDCIYEI